MSDVLHTAQKYHAQLKSEIGKVEDFLRLADELMKDNEAETYTPLTAKAFVPTPQEPRAKRDVPEPQLAESSRPALNGAQANQAGAIPMNRNDGRASLFRGALGPFESERKADVA